MHQKIAGETIRQQEIDAVDAASIVEAQECHHQATESNGFTYTTVCCAATGPLNYTHRPHT
eukprot:COSAG05_NODE_2630_length_2823_cov_2.068282_2_plen_61_part_00